MRQHFIDQKYQVDFDDYAKKHFIKDFEKKYKSRWEVTQKSIKESLERIANLSGTNCIDFICNSNKGTCLVKYDFKIAKSDVSAKASGNRCILDVCNSSLKINILLIYCKDHIDRSKGQETIWWKEHVQDNCGLCCECSQASSED